MIILTSCGGGKSALSERELKSETLKAVLKNYEKSVPKFEGIRGRLKGDYDDGEDQQSISISYRYKKDEVVWMSAKLAGLIQVAKLMITPDNIQFYERIDQSYFDGDFQFISSVLGLELNYEQLQNLLLGEIIKPFDILKSELSDIEGYFQIQSTFENGIIQTVILNANNFKVEQQTLKKGDKEIKIILGSLPQL